ncbi:endopeptidase [Pasteurellaceae bacterium RH1A]|nr:endopeptidase [Pasteurellaceae bacterium RH1A]
MFILKSKMGSLALIAALSLGLSACSSGNTQAKVAKPAKSLYSKNQVSSQKSSLKDPKIVIQRLQAQHKSWQGTRYRIGGTTRKGVDCSGFTQATFRDLFGIKLPRMTVDQAKVGVKVNKSELKAGDLVLFKTGRGPNGRHVGIYVKDGQFLHASTKGGVIYSSIHSPYWSKTYWQARRL